MSDQTASSETHARTMAAKEFVISEVIKQAVVADTPLSELERKMLYFTEGPGAPPDIYDTASQFEDQYDTPAYEKKISTLIRDARKRAKEESPDSEGRWKEALADLSKEDHYILVMVGDRIGAGAVPRPPHDRLKLFATALAVVVIGVGLTIAFQTMSDRGLLKHLPSGATLVLLVVALL